MIMNDPYKKCYSRLNDGDQCEYGQCSEGLACMLSGTIFKCQKRLKENVKCNTDEHCMEGLICRQGQIKNKWVSGSKKCRKLLWSGASCNYDKQCKKGSCVEGICKVGSCDDGQSWKPECKKNACLDKETNTFVFGKVKKSNSWLQVYYFTKKANECAKLIIQKHQAQTCDDWNNQCIVCRN